jgi:3-oxoacyl-[acyl-carrier protein] reductase
MRSLVALVAGASKGIGPAVARRLAREGGDVAITYFVSHVAAMEVAKSIGSPGRRGIGRRAETGSKEGIRYAARTFGRPKSLR